MARTEKTSVNKPEYRPWRRRSNVQRRRRCPTKVKPAQSGPSSRRRAPRCSFSRPAIRCGCSISLVSEVRTANNPAIGIHDLNGRSVCLATAPKITMGDKPSFAAYVIVERLSSIAAFYSAAISFRVDRIVLVLSSIQSASTRTCCATSSPIGVRLYSTCGGTTGKACRCTKPSASSV